MHRPFIRPIAHKRIAARQNGSYTLYLHEYVVSANNCWALLSCSMYNIVFFCKFERNNFDFIWNTAIFRFVRHCHWLCETVTPLMRSCLWCPAKRCVFKSRLECSVSCTEYRPTANFDAAWQIIVSGYVLLCRAWRVSVVFKIKPKFHLLRHDTTSTTCRASRDVSCVLRRACSNMADDE